MPTFKAKSPFHTMCEIIFFIAGGLILTSSLPIACLETYHQLVIDTNGDYNNTDLFVGFVPILLLFGFIAFVGTLMLCAAAVYLWQDIHRISVNDEGLVTFHRFFSNISVPAVGIKSVFCTAHFLGTRICFRCSRRDIETKAFPWRRLLVELRRFNPEIWLNNR